MHGSGIPIWFFIGVLLLIYGGMIFGGYSSYPRLFRVSVFWGLLQFIFLALV